MSTLDGTFALALLVDRRLTAFVGGVQATSGKTRIFNLLDRTHPDPLLVCSRTPGLEEHMHTQSFKEKQIRRKTFWQLALGSKKLDVSEEQIAYFKEHPDEIDELSAPLSIHVIYLYVGVALGLAAIILSKYLKYSGVLDGFSEQSAESIVDIIFETGNAFVGAGVTAVVLGILLNAQQDNAARWREEIRARIGRLKQDD